jgi:hypothetical protein
VNGKNFEKYLRIADHLSNTELVQTIVEFANGVSSVTVANAISVLQWSQNYSSRIPIESVIEFISSHFYEFSEEDIGNMSYDDLERILSFEGLVVRSEDSLLDLLSDLGSDYHSLFRYVRCEYVTVEALGRCLKSVSPEMVESDFWISFCRRLENCSSVAGLSSSRHYGISDRRKWESGFEISEFPLAKSPLNGILTKFTSEGGGRGNENRLLTIDAPSDCESSLGWNLPNLNTPDDEDVKKYWCSQNIPNSWVRFFFKGAEVSVTHYTLKSQNCHDCHRPLHWVVEGSNSGNEDDFQAIDERRCEELKVCCRVQTFACQNANPRVFYRFLRLRQLGKNPDNNDVFCLWKAEFFGSVRRIKV